MLCLCLVVSAFPGARVLAEDSSAEATEATIGDSTETESSIDESIDSISEDSSPEESLSDVENTEEEEVFEETGEASEEEDESEETKEETEEEIDYEFQFKSESERSRLRQLVQSIKPSGYGVIVRTVAEGKRVAELDGELQLLVQRWEDTINRLQQLDTPKVTLITEELGRTIGLLRDIFNPSFESIHINDKEICKDVSAYVELIAPESKKIVHYYKDEQPIFDHFQVSKQMKTGLGRTVGFKNGGYLIVEKTEALWSIDVNSGSKNKAEDQEVNAFNVNMLAAEEIAHQLRLRDIGGLIIIDFIDMSSAENQQALYDHMRELMSLDRAKHNVLKLSKFGLMQITRQRVRPAVAELSQEICPTCMGKGKIQASVLFTDRLEEEIEHYKEHFSGQLRLYVHPYVYAYCKKGFISLSSRWRRRGVKLLENQQLGMLQYRFTDRKGTPLIIKTEENVGNKKTQHLKDSD